MGVLKHENLGRLKKNHSELFRKELYIGSKWHDDFAVKSLKLNWYIYSYADDQQRQATFMVFPGIYVR